VACPPSTHDTANAKMDKRKKKGNINQLLNQPHPAEPIRKYQRAEIPQQHKNRTMSLPTRPAPDSCPNVAPKKIENTKVAKTKKNSNTSPTRPPKSRSICRYSFSLMTSWTREPLGLFIVMMESRRFRDDGEKSTPKHQMYGIERGKERANPQNSVVSTDAKSWLDEDAKPPWKTPIVEKTAAPSSEAGNTGSEFFLL